MVEPNNAPPPIDDRPRVITVRCPRVMHERLREASYAQRKSMNELCLERLNQPLGDSLAVRGSARQLAERLTALVNLAATCRRTNTDAWMQRLADELNRAAAALGDADRAQYDGRDGFVIDRGEGRTRFVGDEPARQAAAIARGTGKS